MLKKSNIALMPLNLKSEDELLFKKNGNIVSIVPKIKKLRNVFVNQQGLVLKSGLLVKGCAFNLYGREDNTFYLPFWKKMVEQYIVCKYGSSLKSITLNDNNSYLLIHSAWFNYSFWINSFLIRLISFLKQNELDNVYLIYPEEWDSISYVKDSLAYFPIRKKIIPKDHHLFVRNLILPETRPWTSAFYSSTIRDVYDWFKFLDIANSQRKRVYLTRKLRNVRCIQNESELLPILEKYNFQVVSFEETSFIDQARLMYQTDLFISIHGAGFSNIMFMPKHTAVLELINFEYASVEYKFPFWKLSNSLEINYLYQFGHVQNPSNTKLIKKNNYQVDQNYLVNENIYIDPLLFEENIQEMIRVTQINLD